MCEEIYYILINNFKCRLIITTFLDLKKFHIFLHVVGSFPDTFSIRWDAPSEDDVAVVDIFLPHNNRVNVFVGRDGDLGSQTFVQSNDFDIPTLGDRAGSNAYSSFYRNITVTLRGGVNNYYTFRAIPVVQIALGRYNHSMLSAVFRLVVLIGFVVFSLSIFL